MTRWNVASALGVAALVAACQAGPGKTSDQAKNQELERRVAELERRSASPTPSPETAMPLQSEAAPPAVAEQGPTAAPRASRTAAPRTASPSRRADARRSEERVDVIRSVPREEPGRGTVTGDPGPRRERAADEMPRIEAITVPEGTQLALVLEGGLSSATSRPGDQVTARIERASSEDGRVVLPGGSVLKGRVTDADSAGRVKGRARLAVSFDRIVVRGRTHPVTTTAIDVTAPSDAKRDAVTVGGGAAAGAIIGAIAGGGKGAKKGAVIGATAGTGAVLLTKGRELEIPAGSRWTVTTRGTTRIE